MFNWLRRLWQSKHPRIPERKVGAAVLQTQQELDAGQVPSRDQEPVLVRGRIWKNTSEIRWELAPEQETAGDASVEDLIKRLGRVERAEVRCSAAKRLCQLGPSATPAISALVNCCIDVDATVRETALSALDAIDPDWPNNMESRKSFPKLVQALRSWSPEVSKAALELLERIGLPVVPDLVNVLSNEEDKIDKVYAIRLLTQLGPNAASAVPGLIQALNSKLPEVRIIAADALPNMGPAREAAVLTLVAGLADPYADCRKAMATSLGRLGAVSEPAIPALLPLLADREVKVREAVADALRKIGPKAIPALVELIQARDARRLKVWLESMIKASQWYTRPKPDNVVTDYQDALDNICWAAYDLMEERASLENAQEVALRVLGEFGAAASSAVPTIAQALEDPNPNIQLAAIQALGKTGSHANIAMPNLIRILFHSAEAMQKAAIETLRNIDHSWMSNPALASAIADLTKQLSKEGQPGEIAVLAFDAIGTTAVPLLIDALETSDWITRKNAARALGRIGAGAKAAIPALTRALEDKYGYVQDEAAKALAVINRPHDN